MTSEELEDSEILWVWFPDDDCVTLWHNLKPTSQVQVTFVELWLACDVFPASELELDALIEEFEADSDEFLEVTFVEFYTEEVWLLVPEAFYGTG